MSDPNLRYGHLHWTSGMAFVAGTPGGPTITLDGDGVQGPGPMVALLLAAGGCAGADVTSILAKKQVVLHRFTIDATGRRAVDHPRRYLELTLVFTLAGEGLTEAKAQHAVDLSVQKYCSVLQSLNPDIPINAKVVVES